MSKDIKASAVVRVNLEIYLTDVWGEDCQLSQIYKQAEDSAKNQVSQMLVTNRANMKLIGKPEIQAIITKV